MLKSKLIHPEILAALGRAGHGSKVLIADGNYPFSNKLGPNAKLVNLNLMPGVVSCVQALEAIVTAIPIGEVYVMQPANMKDVPPIWGEFQKILNEAGINLTFNQVERIRFYEIASDPDVVLTIAAGEQRIYANILLTIGVVMPK